MMYCPDKTLITANVSSRFSAYDVLEINTSDIAECHRICLGTVLLPAPKIHLYACLLTAVLTNYDTKRDFGKYTRGHA